MVRTRKLPMARRETSNQRSVTFTKRRQGLFSKAADLCRIGNAQVAVTATSVCRKDKAFAFGHPSVDAVFDSFLKHSSAPGIASSNATMRSTSSLCEEITELENELKNITKNKEENVGSGEGELPWDCLKEFEKSESVQELEAVVKSLELLLGSAKTKLNDSQYSNISSNSIITRDVNGPDSNGAIVGATDSTLNHRNDHVEIPTGYDDFDFVWDEILQNPNGSTSFSDSITTSNGNIPPTGSTDHGDIPTGGDDFDFVWDDILRYPNGSASSFDSITTSNGNIPPTGGTDHREIPTGDDDFDFVWDLQNPNSSTPGSTFSDSIKTGNAEIYCEHPRINGPWPAFKSTASSFPDNVCCEGMEFVDCASNPPAPNSNLGVSGSISAADYGFNDLVGEYGNFVANDQGLPLLRI